MKLQPNFSWQKYEGKLEDQKQQFQYQLQSQHIQVANSINSTIDDESYWTRERQNSFTWLDGRSVYSKTLATTSWTMVGTVNTIPHGIAGNFTVISFGGYLADGTINLSMPYLDAVTGANSIGVLRSGSSVILTSGGTDYSTYSGHITIYYVKE